MNHAQTPSQSAFSSDLDAVSNLQVASLERLMEEPTYSQLKNLFFQRRAAFKANREAIKEHEAYLRGDNDYNYTVLTGLVPQRVVQQKLASGAIGYGRSDTFFTDFAKHNPQSSILSATKDSLIISNQESHDIRQYSADFDPDGKSREAIAGMTYAHLMVIPVNRVYNAVILEDTKLIEEMISHFKEFWTATGSIQKVIDSAQSAIDRRSNKVTKGLEANQSTVKARKAAFERVMEDVRWSAIGFSNKLATLKLEDFVFGFHTFPDASIGHLHMHVLPVPPELRQYSTSAHDWKTIPARTVMEVIRSEREGGSDGIWEKMA